MSVELNADVLRVIWSSFTPRELCPVSQVCKVWNYCVAEWMEALHIQNRLRVEGDHYTLTSWIALKDAIKIPGARLGHPRDFWVNYLGHPIGPDPVFGQIPRLCKTDISSTLEINCQTHSAVFIYPAIKRPLCEKQMAIVDKEGRLKIQLSETVDSDILNMYAAANNCKVAIGPSEIEVGISIHNVLELFQHPLNGKGPIFTVVPNVADLIYNQCYATQSAPSVVYVRDDVSSASLNKTWEQVYLLPNIQIGGSLPVILHRGFMTLDSSYLPSESKFVRTTNAIKKDGKFSRLTIGGYQPAVGWTIMSDELLAAASLQHGAVFCIRPEESL